MQPQINSNRDEGQGQAFQSRLTPIYNSVKGNVFSIILHDLAVFYQFDSDIGFAFTMNLYFVKCFIAVRNKVCNKITVCQIDLSKNEQQKSAKKMNGELDASNQKDSEQKQEKNEKSTQELSTKTRLVFRLKLNLIPFPFSFSYYCCCC